MELFTNYDLTNLNTLGVSARAKYFVEIKNKNDLEALLQLPEFIENKKIFLGGGSNILFISDFDGIIVLNKLEGIDIVDEDAEHVIIRAMSGVDWHNLVLYTTQRGYWGLENLSSIPGTVGGAPVQNIGAYGSELKDVLEHVEVYSVFDSSRKILTKDECRFGYRDSIFKNEYKGQYFISAITLRLSKIPIPNTSYKILSDYINEHNIKINNPKNISEAVSAIRHSKLPDPKVIGNAGSFFKNVFVSKEQLEKIKLNFSEVKYFEEENGIIKIPAAWLIENSGPAPGISWKGYRVGNVGVHANHALVLVNYGGGSGQEIYDLAHRIINSILLKFELNLTPEVNLI